MTIAVNRNLTNCEIARKKVFLGFNGIRTRGLCVSAAVPYQPELWRPIHWEPANLLSSSTRERNETQNEMMWTVGIQMKWICDHRIHCMGLHSSGHGYESRWSPEKLFFGLFRNCLNCDSLQWSHIHFICIPAVHIISFWIYFKICKSVALEIILVEVCSFCPIRLLLIQTSIFNISSIQEFRF